ncbi:MAG: hypothetical protein NVV57_05860 [Demequina sp.]|nr:hypothetical protein [Demequina sp.]
MTGELKDVLLGGMEAKRKLFASEDFAAGYGGRVVGRVKRRRAVSATAVGGGTVVAVGAVAVGAWQLPWGGMVFGGPGSSPSVVCTTTTPDAVAGSEPFANFAYEWTEEPGAPKWQFYSKDHTDTIGFAAWDGNTLVVTPAYGEVQRVDPDENGIYTFVLGGDITVTSDFADGPDSVMTATIAVDPNLDVTASSVNVIAEDGTVLGQAVHMSDGTLALVVDNRFYPLVDPGGMTYTYVDDAGQRNKVTLIDFNPSVGTAQPAPSPSPSVTCVTSTPEPSASTSPSATLAPTPGPSWSTWPPADFAASPFQCGFEFTSDSSGNSSVSIPDLTWMSSAEAEATISELFSNASNVDFDYSGSDVPAAQIMFDPSLIVTAGGSNTTGPATQEFTTTGNAEEGSGFIIGAQYVVVADGEVVATMKSGTIAAAPFYWDALSSDFSPLYLLNAGTAFDACDGVNQSTIAEGALYAVAGIKTLNNGDLFGPVYAWKKIQPEG